MKALTLIVLITLPFYIIGQGVFTNQTHTTLQKVISDYPYQFKHIRGEAINEDPQSTDFASSVAIPGALNTVITKYSSSDDKPVLSWRCVLAETDDFEAVSKKYRELYDQIKNSIIRMDDDRSFILNG